jgi:hypothetical protein
MLKTFDKFEHLSYADLKLNSSTVSIKKEPLNDTWLRYKKDNE